MFCNNLRVIVFPSQIAYKQLCCRQTVIEVHQSDVTTLKRWIVTSGVHRGAWIVYLCG